MAVSPRATSYAMAVRPATGPWLRRRGHALIPNQTSHVPLPGTFHSVIQDSIPWKDELIKTASRLERKKTQKRWTDRSGFLVERDIMVGAYSVRRLIECWKVSHDLAASRISIVTYPLIESAPNFYNKYFYWELYDLDCPTKVTLSVQETCNQIIHSWMWSLSATEGNELDGIFVSSDRKRGSLLYFIHIDALIELFTSVGEENIAQKTWNLEMDRFDTIVAEKSPDDAPPRWLTAPQ